MFGARPINRAHDHMPCVQERQQLDAAPITPLVPAMLTGSRVSE